MDTAGTQTQAGKAAEATQTAEAVSAPAIPIISGSECGNAGKAVTAPDNAAAADAYQKAKKDKKSISKAIDPYIEDVPALKRSKGGKQARVISFTDTQLDFLAQIGSAGHTSSKAIQLFEDMYPLTRKIFIDIDGRINAKGYNKYKQCVRGAIQGALLRQARKARIAAIEADNSGAQPVQTTATVIDASKAVQTDTDKVITALQVASKQLGDKVGVIKAREDKEVGSILDVDKTASFLADNMQLLNKGINKAIKFLNNKDKYTSKDVSLLVSAQSTLIDKLSTLSTIKKNVAVVHNSEALNAQILDISSFFKSKYNIGNTNETKQLIDNVDNSTSHNMHYVDSNKIETKEDNNIVDVLHEELNKTSIEQVNSNTYVNSNTNDNTPTLSNPPGSLFCTPPLLNDDPSLIVLGSSPGQVG
jgi:hypothetical protein